MCKEECQSEICGWWTSVRLLHLLCTLSPLHRRVDVGLCGRESITGTVFSGSHLPRLPTDRQVAHLTRGRLIVDYLGQTVGSSSC